MPQRFLRPGLTTSDRWNSCSFEAQSMYIRILTLVDDFGRYDGRIPILHAHCFALRPDIKPQDSAGFRSELQTKGLLDVYTINGKEYIQVLRWQERARSERSKYPDPQDSAAERSIRQEKDASIDPRSSINVPSTKTRALVSNWLTDDDLWIELQRILPQVEFEENHIGLWISRIKENRHALYEAIADYKDKRNKGRVKNTAAWLTQRYQHYKMVFMHHNKVNPYENKM